MYYLFTILPIQLATCFYMYVSISLPGSYYPVILFFNLIGTCFFRTLVGLKGGAHLCQRDITQDRLTLEIWYGGTRFFL